MASMFSMDSVKGSLVGVLPGSKGGSTKDKILDPLDLRGKTKATSTSAPAGATATYDTAGRAKAMAFAEEEAKRRRGAPLVPSTTLLSQAAGLGE